MTRNEAKSSLKKQGDHQKRRKKKKKSRLGEKKQQRKENMAPYESFQCSSTGMVLHQSTTNTPGDNITLEEEEEKEIDGLFTHVKIKIDSNADQPKVPKGKNKINGCVSHDLPMKRATNSFQLNPNKIGRLKTRNINDGETLIVSNEDGSAAILNRASSPVPKSLLDTSIPQKITNPALLIKMNFLYTIFYLLPICFLLLQWTTGEHGALITLADRNDMSSLLQKAKAVATNILKTETTSLINLYVEASDGTIFSIETELDLVNAMHDAKKKNVMGVALVAKMGLECDPGECCHHESNTLQKVTNKKKNQGPSLITISYKGQDRSYCHRFDRELIFDSHNILPYHRLLNLVAVMYQKPFKDERLLFTHVFQNDVNDTSSTMKNVKIQNNKEFMKMFRNSIENDFVVEVSFIKPEFVKVINNKNETATFGIDSITSQDGLVSLDELKENAARALLKLSCKAQLLTVKDTLYGKTLSCDEDLLHVLHNTDGEVAEIQLESPTWPSIKISNLPSGSNEIVGILARDALLNRQSSMIELMEQIPILKALSSKLDLALVENDSAHMKVLSDDDLEELYSAAIAKEQQSLDLFVQPKPDSMFFSIASSNLSPLLKAAHPNQPPTVPIQLKTKRDAMWWHTEGVVFPGQYRAIFLVSALHGVGTLNLKAGIGRADQSVDSFGYVSSPVTSFNNPGKNKAVKVTTNELVFRAEPGEKFVIGPLDWKFDLLSDVALEYISPLDGQEYHQ